MVDEFKYTPNQQAVLDAIRNNHLARFGDRDKDFHDLLYLFELRTNVENNIRREIPNLKALLNATEEELQQLPHFGKKTVEAVIKLRNKLEKHRTLLPRFRAAMKAAKAAREYRIKHREIVNTYLKLDRESRTATHDFDLRWSLYTKEGW